jgi:hypothetical protein
LKPEQKGKPIHACSTKGSKEIRKDDSQVSVKFEQKKDN